MRLFAIWLVVSGVDRPELIGLFATLWWGLGGAPLPAYGR